MADSIVNLIQKPQLIEKLGNNSYDIVKKKFTLNNMLQNHRNYFNSL